MALRQIIYASSLAHTQEPSCVDDIIRHAVQHNAEAGFTGLLLFVNRSFLQILEGDADAVSALYEKIRLDPRHTSPWTLSSSLVEERQFGDWSMGLAQASPGDLDQLVRQNDFFQRGRCLTELDESMARKILMEFRAGMWRLQVH